MNANSEARLASMMVDARQAVRKGAHWYTASELTAQAKILGLPGGPTPSAWTRQRQLFALELDGERRFPAYGLNPQTGQPLPAMAAILNILAGYDDWFLAAWFEAVNSYLGGARPREVLTQDPVRVIVAAQAEVEAIDHG